MPKRALGAVLTVAAFAAVVSAPAADAASVTTWDKVAQCEATGNWQAIDASNRYFGGLQFSQPTWRAYGGEAYADRADHATKKQQILIGEKVLAGQGQGAWPNCGWRYGLEADHADPYPEDAPLPAPVSATGDLTGDGRPDLLARANTPDGTLWIYPGAGGGKFGSRVDNGNWAVMNQVTALGDVTGDGRADVAAVERSTGKLWIYPGQADGHLGARVDNSGGWGALRVSGSRDLDGDGRGDLLATDTRSGDLYLYPGLGTGHFGTRLQIGTNWDAMSVASGAGDLTGDGRDDVVAVESGTGKLFVYPGLGDGRLGPRVQAGTGWQVMTSVSGAGDHTGDGKDDLVARSDDGKLWVYPGQDDGRLGTRIDNGGGWNFS
ncbi:FG-GAP-like repeat-containing protein [Streptomyces sp. NPDC089919]|uniref:FG-GAP-like repeat-containing protein n=1 Tax=Streptomyces sp. NPDC089919 TaxID=3155188 RepID=UPI003434F025